MTRPSTLASRVMGTLVPALVGGVIGYAYARLSLDLPEKSSFPAIYGAAGAAIVVLAVRLSAIFRAIWAEFRGRRGE